jgi:hypothetical protein
LVPDDPSTAGSTATTVSPPLPVLGSLAGIWSPSPEAATQRQIVAVEQSAFLGLDDALAALTAGIGQTVQGRQTALRSDPALGFASRFAAAEETSLAAFSDLDLDGCPAPQPQPLLDRGLRGLSPG